jgi:hypothetical protein
MSTVKPCARLIALLTEVAMKYLVMFLVAVVGGLAGAGGMYFGTRPQRVSSHAQDVTSLRADLQKLRHRIEGLEAHESSTSPISNEDLTAPAMTREELLEAARSAARDVATEIARLESADAAAALDRKAALARAIDQRRAPHEDTRRNGIRRLRRMFASEASAEVIPSLSDESALVRMEAAT